MLKVPPNSTVKVQNDEFLHPPFLLIKITNTMMHVYKGGYWEGKYSRQWGVEFPDIFYLLIIN